MKFENSTYIWHPSCHQIQPNYSYLKFFGKVTDSYMSQLCDFIAFIETVFYVYICRYVCHQFSTVTVLMLRLHGSVSICGKMLVRCMSGNSAVHGFSMNANVGWQKIFSPSTHSLLVIKAIDGEDVDGDDDDDDDDWMLMLRNDERRQVEAYSTEYPVILLLQRLACPACELATSTDEFRMLDSRVYGLYLKSVDVTVIAADGDVATIKEPESFSCVANKCASYATEGNL